MVVANAAQADAVALGDDRRRRHRRARSRRSSKGDTALIHGAWSRPTPTSQAAFDTVERVRDAVHAVTGADALVGGASAIYRRHRGGLRATTTG